MNIDLVQIPNPVNILWHSCIDKEHMKEKSSRVPEITTDGMGKEWVILLQCGSSMPSLTFC